MLCTLQMVVIRILVIGIFLSFYNPNKFNSHPPSLGGRMGHLLEEKVGKLNDNIL